VEQGVRQDQDRFREAEMREIRVISGGEEFSVGSASAMLHAQQYARPADMPPGVVPSRELPIFRPDRFWYLQPKGSVSAVDGDTIQGAIELTMDSLVRASVRLASINAPEMKGETILAGKTAQDELDFLIGFWTYIWIRTIQNKTPEPTLRKQKRTFGRYVAFLFDPHGNSINDAMVRAGMAEPYMIELLDGGDSFQIVEG
jgi:endonuclease YncB( thermonuclease family)